MFSGANGFGYPFALPFDRFTMRGMLEREYRTRDLPENGFARCP